MNRVREGNKGNLPSSLYQLAPYKACAIVAPVRLLLCNSNALTEDNEILKRECNVYNCEESLSLQDCRPQRVTKALGLNVVHVK